MVRRCYYDALRDAARPAKRATAEKKLTPSPSVSFLPHLRSDLIPPLSH